MGGYAADALVRDAEAFSQLLAAAARLRELRVEVGSVNDANAVRAARQFYTLVSTSTRVNCKMSSYDVPRLLFT